MTREEVLAALLEACPGAALRWQRHRAGEGTERPGVYEDLAVFAHHVAEAAAVGDASELPSFFALLERMVCEGTSEVKKLATIGLIEDLQRMAAGTPAGLRALEGWLGPESRRRWRAVATMWDGSGTLARLVRLRRPAVAGAGNEIN